MRELSAKIPDWLREARYWTEEEIADPQLTESDAYRYCLYLATYTNTSHPYGLKLACLTPDETHSSLSDRH